MQYTDEQAEIISHDYQAGQTVVVEAYAGTGKTFTLVELAKQLCHSRPNWRGLYLCYNKSVQIEARQKFPSNIECRTTHSLAWPGYGSEYQHKLGNARLRDIMRVMPEEVRSHENKWEIVAAAYDSLKDFMYSDAKKITGKCISGHNFQRFRNAWRHLSKEDQKEMLVSLCKHIWMLMTKKETTFGTDEPDLNMPHDGYLKLYQLDAPEMRYDFILFDEAQDANPATLDIVLKQQGLTKVFVGDTHQQIYGFRGSKNALAQIDADASYLLSHSFRFGEAIAEFSSRCLNRLKSDMAHPVVVRGAGAEGSVMKYAGGFEPFKSDRAVITRTNGSIVSYAWACVLEQVPFTIVGGANSTALIAAESAYMLFRSQDKYNMKDKFIKSFNSWGEFAGYARDSQDNEALDGWESSPPTVISCHG